MSSAFVRATKAAPCLVCGAVKWCSTTSDGELAICTRQEEGSIRTTGLGHFVHRLRERDPNAPRPIRRVELPAAPIDLAPTWRPRLEKSWREPARLRRLLERLGLGLGAGQAFFAFEFGGELHVPAQDVERRWSAIQKRTATGAKFYVRHKSDAPHRPAPFVPVPIGNDPVLVPEGFTDAAALAGLGFTAIGRTSSKPGRFELEALRHFVRGRAVVVLGENDLKSSGAWPGREGAEFTARALLLSAGTVRVAFPPADRKDARAAVLAGWSRADIEAAIEAAEPLRVELVTRGGQS